MEDVIESQINNTDILYDLHGTILKRKKRFGREDNLVDGLSYDRVQAILNSSDDELEKRLVRVSFHPDFYFISDGEGMSQKDYMPHLTFLIRNGLDTKDYIKLFTAYLFKKNTLSTICNLREQGFNLEFHSGISAKYASELGRLFNLRNPGFYTGILKPDDIESGAETKIANIEYRIRQRKRVITLENDPYLNDLFTKLWPIQTYHIGNTTDWDQLYRGVMDERIASIPTQGMIYRDYQIEDVLGDLSRVKAR